MQDILREYGPAIITVVAVVALIGLITVLIGSDQNSVVGQAFAGLIDGFAGNAGVGDSAKAAVDAATQTVPALP